MQANSPAADALSTLPLCYPANVIGDRHVLVIAPHPDDETLGCGGLLAWAAESRRMPRVLFLTNGERSHRGSLTFPISQLARLRQREAMAACSALGIPNTAITFLNLPDAGLEALSTDETRTVVQTVREWIMKSVRAAVCVTASTDGHSDHVAAHRLAIEALHGTGQYRLFAYPIWTWLQSNLARRPVGWRIDIASFRPKKCMALEQYASQQGKVVTDATDAFILPRPLIERAHQDYEVLLDAYV